MGHSMNTASLSEEFHIACGFVLQTRSRKQIQAIEHAHTDILHFITPLSEYSTEILF